MNQWRELHSLSFSEKIDHELEEPEEDESSVPTALIREIQLHRCAWDCVWYYHWQVSLVAPGGTERADLLDSP